MYVSKSINSSTHNAVSIVLLYRICYYYWSIMFDQIKHFAIVVEATFEPILISWEI